MPPICELAFTATTPAKAVPHNNEGTEMPITNERREQLIAKYKLNAPPNPDDSIATAIIDGEQTLTKM